MEQVAKLNANPGPDHVLRIFWYLKFTGPMGIVNRYSLSNVGNQLVLFLSANDQGFLVIPCYLDIPTLILHVILIRVDLHLVLYLGRQVLRYLGRVVHRLLLFDQVQRQSI